MVVAHGEIWWADLAAPSGSAPAFRRPVLNVLLQTRITGLSKDSVANVSQVITLDQDALTERVGKLSHAKLELVLAGLDVILGR